MKFCKTVWKVVSRRKKNFIQDEEEDEFGKNFKDDTLHSRIKKIVGKGGIFFSLT